MIEQISEMPTKAEITKIAIKIEKLSIYFARRKNDLTSSHQATIIILINADPQSIEVILEDSVSIELVTSRLLRASEPLSNSFSRILTTVGNESFVYS
jgi:hypothetical protein